MNKGKIKRKGGGASMSKGKIKDMENLEISVSMSKISFDSKDLPGNIVIFDYMDILPNSRKDGRETIHTFSVFSFEEAANIIEDYCTSDNVVVIYDRKNTIYVKSLPQPCDFKLKFDTGIVSFIRASEQSLEQREQILHSYLIDHYRHDPWDQRSSVIEKSENIRLQAAMNVLKINSQSSMVVNASGDLPLHVALLNDNPNWNFISLLISTFPEALLTPDSQKIFPLHRAIAHPEKNEDVIKLIIDICPQTSTLKNHHGKLPIHVAFKYCAMPTIVMIILDSNPKAARTLDDQNNSYLLHYFCSNSSVGDFKFFLEISMKLIELCPNAVRIQDRFGNLPLHLLCKNTLDIRVSLSTLMLLIKLYPESPHIANSSGKIPISCTTDMSYFDALWSFATEEEIATVLEQPGILIKLLKHDKRMMEDKQWSPERIPLWLARCPEKVWSIDKDGKILFDLAKKWRVSDDVLLCILEKMRSVTTKNNNPYIQFDNTDLPLSEGNLISFRVDYLWQVINIAKSYCERDVFVVFDKFNTVWVKKVSLSGASRVNPNRCSFFYDIFEEPTEVATVMTPEHMKFLGDLRWKRKRMAMLVAYRVMEGVYAYVLKMIAEFV